MSKYLIGLTASSSKLTDPILITNESLGYPTPTTTLPTLWTLGSSTSDGVDARILESKSSLVLNAAPWGVMFSASIFWPRGMPDDAWRKHQAELVRIPRPFFSTSGLAIRHKREVSLTIPMNPISLQVTRFHQVQVDGMGWEDRETLFQASGPVELYKQALFQRRMPGNAHNFTQPYGYSGTPQKTFSLDSRVLLLW